LLVEIGRHLPFDERALQRLEHLLALLQC